MAEEATKDFFVSYNKADRGWSVIASQVALTCTASIVVVLAARAC